MYGFALLLLLLVLDGIVSSAIYTVMSLRLANAYLIIYNESADMRFDPSICLTSGVIITRVQ